MGSLRNIICYMGTTGTRNIIRMLFQKQNTRVLLSHENDRRDAGRRDCCGRVLLFYV